MISRVSAALVAALSMPLANADVLEISSGKIEGERAGNVVSYRGVPYAQPPVGELRWRAPRPAKPWSGVRKALKPASPCMQVGSFFATDDETVFDKAFGSEDCLYLNVWAPLADDSTTDSTATDSTAGNSARPVLVFFHGGSGIVGDASHPIYDGRRLAAETGAVVITANYRLSIWGSLHSPALQTGDPVQDSGSFYLLDMIRVLDWVHENCAALDCDAGNITISGQSAGAVAVLALLRSPLAKGKFQKAISISGVPFSASKEQARERTQKFLISLMLKDGTAASEEDAQKHLAAQTPEQLREYLYRKTPETLLKAGGFGLSPQAVDDGTVLVSLEKPVKMAAKVVSPVPLLIGTVQDEMTTLVPITGIGRSATGLWSLFDGEPRTETINQKLGWFKGFRRDTKIRFASWYLNRNFKKVLNQYAEQLPAVYAYRFEWDNYPDPWKSELGSFHGLDIPFIFGNFIDDHKIYMRFAWTEQNREEREALHQKMVASLKAFIYDGNPSVENAEWRPWNQQKHKKIWEK